MSGLSTSWVDAIGWMLLYSSWQGAAIAIVLALALRLLHRAPAQARYLAACVAMFLMIALPTTVIGRPRAIPSIAAAPRVTDPRLTSTEGTDSTKLESMPALRPWQTRIVPVFPTIVGLWMAGAGLFSLRLLGGWALTRRWVQLDTRPLVCPRIDRLKERMGVRHAVALLESARVEVPMVVGWVRPAILVPVAALSGLTAPELEAILAHELAHIRRHDYLVNILQSTVEVLMFYHPVTWWITSVIRREREHCCDDMAVAACGDRPTYARALAAMEGLRAPALSLSPAANGGNLLARVRRILEPKEESMKPVRILVSLGIVLAVVPIWLARADDQGPARADTRSAPPPIDHPVAVPSRSFADIVTEVDAAPTGRSMIDTVAQPKAELPVLPANPGESDGPPSEAEVWAKVPKSPRVQPSFYEVQRNNVRISIEKISEKTDAVKVYPLAGPCQLVHRHYKCTVNYDELYRSEYPIPFNHVDRKVEVVFIDKDFLRRATPPVQPSKTDLDDQVDRVSRELEQLLRKLQLDRQEQERVLDRLFKELEGLKKRPDLDKINDAEAEKTFREGMYYKRVGKAAAAEFAFGKILRRWPDSPWAVKAKAQQVQADPKTSSHFQADPETSSHFNFAVGGFY